MIYKLSFVILTIMFSSTKSLEKSGMEIVLKSLETTEIENKIGDINSIVGSGVKINDMDTFNYKVCKMLYSRYKVSKSNLTYQELIIKNEDSSYHQRNDEFFKRKNQYFDLPMFDDLVNFNIYYAISQNLKRKNFELISSENGEYEILFKFNNALDYKIYVNQDNYLINRYHRFTTVKDSRTQIVKLSNYKNIDGILFYTQKEFLSSYQNTTEAILFDSIKFNTLTRSDFNIP